MSGLPRIRRLDEAVVNRIAAGEIIHRPANALKELLENALDAGATAIQIVARDGGLKLLQITDNGHGIARDDLAIVCERFTTSKLARFEDLDSIATFGFRGEALASISHVARLSITTKTAASDCAFKAHYSDGKLVPMGKDTAEPKPCAGNVGTQITVEDLFFNVVTRRKALKNFNDEYHRILDVVMRYGVHNAGVSLSCRKQGAVTPDVHTTAAASVEDAVRQVYGVAVAKEVLPVDAQNEQFRFKLKGLLTNANYSVKKMTLLLFINNRLVESPMVKRMVETLYSPYLPKGGHPWVYLSLMLPAETLDVNVHPTKREVHFMYEDEIVEAVSEQLQQVLRGSNSSRVFAIQSLATPSLTSALKATNTCADTHTRDNATKSVDPPIVQRASDNAVNTVNAPLRTQPQSTKPVTATNRLVRTDNKLQTLDAFVKRLPSAVSNTMDKMNPARNDNSNNDNDKENHHIGNSSQETNNGICTLPELQPTVTTEVRQRKEVRLTSVLELRRDVKTSVNLDATQVMRDYTFVGVVDAKLALIQHQTKLYLVNFHRLSRELFYQLVLEHFSNCGLIAFSDSVSIRELLQVAIDGQTSAVTSNENFVDDTIRLLLEKSQMLLDYFSIEISVSADSEDPADAQLRGIPLLLDGYVPCLDKMPMFLLRLGLEVDWSHERSCLEGIANELSLLYAVEPTIPDECIGNDQASRQQFHYGDAATEPEWIKQYKWNVQHVIFPAFRKQLAVPEESLVAPADLIQLADLPELYKIFERC